MESFVFEAIGTRWVIDVYDRSPLREHTLPGTDLETKVRERIEEFDTTFSRFRQDSLVTRMAHSAGEYILPEEGAEMLRLFRTLYDLTDGKFTPLIGSLMVEAGYDAAYSLKPKKLHHPKSWDDVLVLSGARVLLKEPVLLDFGALGKGKLIDIVSGLLDEHGISSYCVDAGGDIRYRGTKQLRVGLEHPQQPDQVIGVAKLKNMSIAASAGNRRRWGEYHHILDPKTLSPVKSVLATWVIAENAMLADALATALFFAEPTVFRKDFSFSSLILQPDFSADMSRDFPAELFYN